MNVMGLTTRGYLGGPVMVISPTPPEILSATPDSPSLKGMALLKGARPSGTSELEGKPSIRGGGAAHQDPVTAPTISGSKTDKPVIKKK